MNFKEYKLADLLTIKNGKDYHDLCFGNVPVYGTGGIMCYVDKCMYDGESILLPRKGTLDTIHYINGKFWTIDTIYWTIVRSDIVYTKYLYLYLSLLDTAKRNTGSAQPSMTFDTYYSLKIKLPDYENQVRIADFIFSLLNKIDVNSQINAELESLAKTIYDYWFLQFDFPNKEGKPYKSSGGAMVWNEDLKMEIPEGWEVTTLGKIIVEQPKSTIPVEDAKTAQGNIPFFTSGDAILKWNKPLVSGRNCYLNDGGNADVRYYIGETAYSTHTWCITGKNGTSDFLYLTLVTLKPELDIKYFQGSTLKNLNKSALKKRPFFVPPVDVMASFNKIIQPIFDMISENVRQNQELTNLRDFLLPLLMNGQVGFKDA